MSAAVKLLVCGLVLGYNIREEGSAALEKFHPPDFAAADGVFDYLLRLRGGASGAGHAAVRPFGL